MFQLLSSIMQKIVYFLRICISGEQSFQSSTTFTYISNENFDFIFVAIFEVFNFETWN